MVLFVGEMLTATAMGFYERQIEKAVVLALFVPLIISSGGNSGSQAATLIIRAMALGEVRLRDWWSVMRRELLSGLLLGTLLGTIGFLRIGVWSAFSGIYGPHWALVGVTVAFSLLGIVSWARSPARCSVRPEAGRPRPRHVVGPVRGDAGGRHGAGHLHHGRRGDPARDLALTGRVD